MYKTFVVFILFCFNTTAQTLQQAIETDRDGKMARFVFYNIENLFDTVLDAGIDDKEFLPDSPKAWNSIKYRLKIGNMAKAIRSAGGWTAPELVAFCEIENRYVLQDLIAHEALKSARYEIVHYDSNDPRGIDVGLIYKPDVLTVLHSEPIRMRDENVRTRDILYVKFLLAAVDTIHAFVNHWPSRRGGAESSEPRRIAAAKIIADVADSILQNNPKANIVVMGDFNDTPKNESLKLLTSNAGLMNLMAQLPEGKGTHKYRGVWDYLDQILVSQPLLSQQSFLRISGSRAFVFEADFLLEEDDRYGDTFPFRTFLGDVFINGYSDHLPVFIDIQFQ